MLKIVLLMLCISLNVINSQTAEYMIAPPSGSGTPFSTKCYNPNVSGFHITARCIDDTNSYRWETFDFSHCVKNYDGNLSRYTGRTDELYTKDCYTDGYNLKCKCQQPAGGYKTCRIDLDSIFFVNNGRLSC